MNDVICLWSFIPDLHYTELCWKLEDFYEADEDREPVENGHISFSDWIFDEDGEKYEGRMVTMWSIESGVNLIEFTPPSLVPWIAYHYIEDLHKHKKWHQLLNHGYTVHMITVAKARSLLGKMIKNEEDE